MDQIGWGYQKFEDEGLISPVTSIECKFKHSTTFPDKVFIEVLVDEIRSIKLRLRYIMTDESGKVVCEAASEHCFLDSKGKFVRLNKEYPDFYSLICSLADQTAE